MSEVREIARAAGKAVLLWIAGYVIIIHAMVLWKLTTNVPLADLALQQQEQLLLAPQHHAPPPLVLRYTPPRRNKTKKTKRNKTRVENRTVVLPLPPLPLPEPEIILVNITEYQIVEEELDETERQQLSQLQAVIAQINTTMTTITEQVEPVLAQERAMIQQQMAAMDRWLVPEHLLTLDVDSEEALFYKNAATFNASSVVSRTAVATTLLANLTGLEKVLANLVNVSRSKPNFTGAYHDLQTTLEQVENFSLAEQHETNSTINSTTNSTMIHQASLTSLTFWTLLSDWFVAKPELRSIDWHKSMPEPNCTKTPWPSDIAYVVSADVEERVQQIRSLLDHRAAERESTWPVSLETTAEQLEDVYSTIIQQTIGNLTAVLPTLAELSQTSIVQAAEAASVRARTATERNHQMNCVQSEQDVLAWLEAGLDAMYRQQDIRQAILDAVQTSRQSLVLMDGSDEKQKEEQSSLIILDAILPGDQVPPKELLDTLGRRVNVRTVLDTPLTYQAAVWMDRIVDQISGYNEHIDQFLDTHLASLDSIGRQLVVNNVLNVAGQIELPSRKVMTEIIDEYKTELMGRVLDAKSSILSAYQQLAWPA